MAAKDGTFKIARVGLHMYEEPCISGDRGSGTIFFSGCNMKCQFCQNYEISHGDKGLEVSKEELLLCMEYLQDQGAENINLVTPPANVNDLVDVLKIAKGILHIPIVWNSNGYETVANLQKLEGLVDVYMPDFKYSDEKLAVDYSNAPNYFEVAKAAITEMRRQQPKAVFDDDGMMQKGVLVRHLVLPRGLRNTMGVMNAIAGIDKNMYVSVMGQYFPTPTVEGHPALSRRLNEIEYNAAIDGFYGAGLKFGFSQELESAIKDYVPVFDLEEVKKIIGRV